MTFEDNKKFWKEFIELYKENSCLWDIHSKDYSNRNARNRAYQSLVVKCREKFPTAEKYFVTKKINSLRTSFRRQFRKMQESTGEVVEPTLWYFDLLLFTLDQEELRPGVLPSMTDELGDDDMTINETDSQQELLVAEGPNEMDSDAPAPCSPQPDQEGLTQVPKKRKRRKESVSWTDPNRKDSSSIFGDFVADSIRNLKNQRLQSWVRHQISNVLYTAEQAYYQETSQLPKTDNLNYASTLPNLQCEGELNTTDQVKKAKQNNIVNEPSGSLMCGITSSNFVTSFKEEPPFSDPPSPTSN